MILRDIDLSKDYLQLCIWWSTQGWPCVQKDMLPTTGLIVEDYCAGFIYSTDSSMCLLEWVIADKDTDKELRSQALDILLNGLVKKTEELGFKHIYTSTKHTKLIERYKQFNFEELDLQMTNLMRTI